MASNENDPLIIKTEKRKITVKTNDGDNKTSFSVMKTTILSFSTVLFNCSLQMTNITVNQYVYKWLDENSKNQTSAGANYTFWSNKTFLCPTNEKADESELQKQASKWIWYFTLTEYGFPLFIILSLGINSDFIGRKPLMLISTFGNTIMSCLVALFIYLDWNIAYFLIGIAIGGISGARYTFHIGYLGSVADTTDKNKARSFKIATLDILMSLGRSSAQLVTGYVIKLAGYVYPVIISSGCCLGSFVLILLFIPETNKFKDDQSLSFRKGYLNLIGLYRNQNILSGQKRWKLILCLLSFVIFFVACVSRINIEILFQLRSPFCYTSDLIGWYQFAKECIQGVLGTSLIKLFHLCLKDEMIALIACVTATSYFVITAFSSESWMLYVAITGGILTTVPLPMYRGMASRMVDDDKQGALFTNIVILQIICRLGGSSIFNNIYAITQTYMAGLTFLAMGSCYIMAAVLILPLLISGLTANNRTVMIQSKN